LEKSPLEKLENCPFSLDLLGKKRKSYPGFDFSGHQWKSGKKLMAFAMFSENGRGEVSLYPVGACKSPKIADLFEMTRLDKFYKIPHEGND